MHTLAKDQLSEMLAFANAVGALSTTRRGGIPSMPDIIQVTELLGKS